MSKMDALMEKLAAEECAAWSDEERKWGEVTLQALTDQQRTKFAYDPLDVLCIVRGFQTENDRRAATVSAVRKIATWREKVDFYNLLQRRQAHDEKFYKAWPEKIHGADKWGHFLQAVRCTDIDTDKLIEIPEENIEVLQGQKMKAYGVHKADLSAQLSTQLYKHSLVVDLNGMSMGMLRGQKRAVLKLIFGIGSDYYPETMWKIYLVNAPMIFRGIWAMVKPWLHPITVNKIQILGSNKEAMAQMTKDHIPISAIPDWLGGGNKGNPTFEYIQNLILKMQQGQAAPHMMVAAGARPVQDPGRRPCPPPPDAGGNSQANGAANGGALADGMQQLNLR